MHNIRQFSAFYSHFQVRCAQMTSLPGHFRSPEITWRHFLSRDCLLVRATALHEMKCTVYASFSAFFTHFQVNSCQMTSLSVHIRSPEVMWHHFLSPDCLLLRVTTFYEVKCTAFAGFRPSTATSRWLPVKWRHFRVTSGHLRSREVITCHVTASSCNLQDGRKWNVQYTPVFGLLQPLPGYFRSNDATSGSLPITWGHVTSFSVTWLPPPASYSLAGGEVYSLRQFSAFYIDFQVNSGQITSLLGHFRSPEVTWHHFLSRDCLLLRATALQEVKCTVYASFRPSTSTSRLIPVKLRHFWVTSGLLRSCDIIFCHVTAFSCELQPCRKWNARYIPVFSLLHPLPGDCRSNDVTFGSLPVTWVHVTSFSVTWLPPPACYSLVGSEMYSIRQFSAFYRHFQVTSGKMTPLLVHLWSFEMTWRHFLSRDCLLLRATAL